MFSDRFLHLHVCLTHVYNHVLTHVYTHIYSHFYMHVYTRVYNPAILTAPCCVDCTSSCHTTSMEIADGASDVQTLSAALATRTLHDTEWLICSRPITIFDLKASQKKTRRLTLLHIIESYGLWHVPPYSVVAVGRRSCGSCVPVTEHGVPSCVSVTVPNLKSFHRM